MKIFNILVDFPKSSTVEVKNEILIQLNADRAKVQLIDQQNNCLAIPYVVKADKMGLPAVFIDRAALASCD